MSASVPCSWRGELLPVGVLLCTHSRFYSIAQTVKKGDKIGRGDEIGYFAFGGSVSGL